VERYRHVVAIVTGDLRRYRRASEELKTALCLTPLAVMLPATLYYLRVLQDLTLLPILGLSLGLAAWARVIDTVASLSSFRRKLDEELPFYTLTAVAVSRTGLEPVELLKFLSESRVLNAFRELGRRFWSFSEVFGSSEGLSMLSRLAGGRVRLFLTEYASALSSGTALQHLRDRVADFVRSASLDVERSLWGRMTVAVITSTFFGVAPVILISVTFLYTASLDEVQEPQPAIQALAPAIAGVSALLAVVLPGYPLAAQVVVERRTLRRYYLLLCVGMASLALPPVLLSQRLVGLESFRELALQSSSVAAVLGVPPFIQVFKALTTGVDGLVEEMAQHVRVYRSMHLFRSGRLEELARKSVRPWLIDYLSESAEFFRVVGDVDPQVFDVFVMFVSEMRRALRKAMTHILFMLAVTLITPILSTTTMSLGGGLGVAKEVLLVGYVSALGFGCVAGKIALGRNVSTLMPGLAIMLYSLTLPA